MFRRLFAQMADDGWLGIGWPTEHGGQGRSALEQFIFFDEAERAGAPIPFLTIKSIGPVLMHFGTPEQQRDYLPRILRGDIHFAIGYTEPEAGTDLASLKTRAVRDGDEYVINGNKVFTSYAHDADYIWLAARTSTEGKKQQGDLDLHRAHRRAGARDHPDSHPPWGPDQRHVLRRRAGAGLGPRG